MNDPTVHPDEPTKYPTDSEAQNYAALFDMTPGAMVRDYIAQAYRDGHAVGYRWGFDDGYQDGQ